MYICICNGVTERDIDHCVSSCGACSLEDLQRELGVASACGCCRESAEAMLPGRTSAVAHLVEQA